MADPKYSVARREDSAFSSKRKFLRLSLSTTTDVRNGTFTQDKRNLLKINLKVLNLQTMCTGLINGFIFRVEYVPGVEFYRDRALFEE